MRSKILMTVLLAAIMFGTSMATIVPIEGGPTRGSVPVLWGGKVSPTTGDSNTTFNFTVNYRDDDNNTPSYILVSIDRFDYNMSSVNQTPMNITTGEMYYYNFTGYLSPGQHEYYFYAWDNDGQARDPTGIQSFHLNISSDSHQPELFNSSYHPYNPTNETGVNFTVTYRDLDGDAPISVDLIIYDGLYNHTYSMNISTGNYTSGVTCYIVRLMLPAGYYDYRFHTVNVRNQSVYNPMYDYYYLNIDKAGTTDHPPALYSPSMFPTSPTSEDHIYFYVDYRDLDDEGPDGIFVEIFDNNRSFYRYLDMYTYQSHSYSQGLTYEANTTLENGTYNYRFWCYNSVNVTLPESNTYYFVVGNPSPVLPMLYSPGVSPQNPVQNQTVNFTVNYKDPSGGREPYSIKLNIRKSGSSHFKFNLNMAKTSGSYQTGVLYYYEIALLEGNYTYYFELVVGNYSARLPTDQNYTLYVRPVSLQDHAPVLKTGSHSPTSPKDGDNITFTVRYQDMDGDAPSHIVLYLGPRSVNGSNVAQYLDTYNMTWTGTSYSTGVTASIVISLKEGHYRYCFVSSNSKHGFIVWYPGNSSYMNLDVGKKQSNPPVNSAPVLHSPAVSPTRPVQDQWINFTIWYKDVDGDAPSSMNLYIGPVSANATVYPMLVKGTSYSTGVAAYKSIKLSAGNYSYHFTAGSGNHTVSYPYSGTYQLHVATSGGNVDPKTNTSSVSISIDGSGDVNMTEIEVDEGLTLSIEDYKKGSISFMIDSDEVKDRIISFEIDKDLLGEISSGKGLIIKVDGEKIGSGTLGAVRNSSGDNPIYNLEESDGKYFLHLYLPDASSNRVDASVEKEENEDAGNVWIIAILIVIVLIAVAAVAGIWAYATVLQKRKKEEFFRDFDLEIEEESEKRIVSSGSLDEEEMDWDQFIE